MTGNTWWDEDLPNATSYAAAGMCGYGRSDRTCLAVRVFLPNPCRLLLTQPRAMRTLRVAKICPISTIWTRLGQCATDSQLHGMKVLTHLPVYNPLSPGFHTCPIPSRP